jgi:sulfatase maturation enzyme AslB (radical SAM superfamily)
MTVDNFCVLPFIQVVMRTDGSLSPCCVMTGDHNVRNISIQQYWKTDKLEQIRYHMLNQDAKISACDGCHKQEEITGKSQRTDSLNQSSHKFLNKKYHKKTLEYYHYADLKFPKKLEMHVSNICNLKCLTCCPEDSSLFLSENRILKISEHSQKDYQLDDDLIQAQLKTALSQDIDRLDLRGGESMLVPGIKKILGELDNDRCNITLRIQTNGTILDNEWKSILNKFQRVELMISIDAYADANTYIRYPSIWQDIENNVDYFQSLPNVDMYINCTVSNLNFLSLPALIDWARLKKIYFHYTTLLGPEIYQFTNMPSELFESAKQNLKTYPEVLPLLNSQADPVHWQDFCRMIDTRDTHRKNRIFDFVPEFKQYWNS